MKTQLIELTAGDIPEAVNFILREVQEQRRVLLDAAAALDRYRWFLEENPRRRGGFIGWGLRDETGQLAGTNLCMWQHYVRGEERAAALHSSDYYVTEAARGPGSLALLLNMTRRTDADLSICTTANVNGAKVWQAIRGIPVPGGDHEVLVPVNLAPLAAESLARRIPWKWLRRSVTKCGGWMPRVSLRFPVPADLAVEPLRVEDCAALQGPAGACWEPERDEAWLRWRYFAPYSSRRCTLLRLSRTGSGGDLFVGTHLGSRGEGGRIRSLTVMDAWGAVDSFAAPEVMGALVRHFRGQLDLIGLRLHTASLWRAALPGARLRPLEAVTHWMLNSKRVLNPGEWRFTMGDGDACT